MSNLYVWILKWMYLSWIVLIYIFDLVKYGKWWFEIWNSYEMLFFIGDIYLSIYNVFNWYVFF